MRKPVMSKTQSRVPDDYRSPRSKLLVDLKKGTSSV